MASASSAAPYITLLNRDTWADNRLIRYIRNRRADAIRKHLFASRAQEHPVFSVPWGDYESSLFEHIQDADVVHLHWVAGLFKLKNLIGNLPQKANLLWTLHDMNPITGGYHYETVYDPNKWTRYEKKVVRQHTQAIQSIQNRVCCSAPSAWLTQLAAQSKVFQGTRSAVLRNCVPSKVFYPRNKAACKTKFGLSTEKKTLLFVNHNNDDPNKGLQLLLDAIDLLAKKGLPFQTLTVGANGNSTSLSKHLGPIYAPEKMAEVYSAADYFVIPSNIDNYPNTIIESFACGVPAIGFETGGIPEQIEDGATGYLFRERTCEVLAKTIEKAISATSDDEYIALQQKCLQYVESNNTEQVVAKAHLALYHTLISSQKTCRHESQLHKA